MDNGLSHVALHSEACLSTTRSRKRSLELSGPARRRVKWLPPSRQPTDKIRRARLSAATLKQHALPLTALSDSIDAAMIPANRLVAFGEPRGALEPGARPRRRSREQEDRRA